LKEHGVIFEPCPDAKVIWSHTGPDRFMRRPAHVERIDGTVVVPPG
jgi:hypothetical protein